jgi:uncharacterized protein involved in exopolysaccharide biosynthesis
MPLLVHNTPTDLVAGDPAEPVGLGLGTLIERFRRRWWISLAAFGGAILLAIVYLNIATYRYTAELIVSPAQNDGARVGGGFGALRELGALGGFALPMNQGALPMMQFTETLTSRETAEALAADQRLMRQTFGSQWDEASGQWREPPSLLRPVRQTVMGLVGAPSRVWAPPGPVEMQEYLRRNLNVEENPRTPFVAIRLSHPDPDFAVLIINRTTDITNEMLRQRALDRTSENIRYISSQLALVTLAEHRSALAEALSQQEKQRMFASSSAPFAAEPLGQTVASPRPTSPSPLQVLVVAVVLGGLAGFLVLLWPNRRPVTVA